MKSGVKNPRQKMFLDIPTAAGLLGYSVRQFRRLIEEDRIPVVQIGRRHFILSRDIRNLEPKKSVGKD